MTIYTATFVNVPCRDSESFAKICQTAEGVLTDWRNAVPARRQLAYEVSCYDGSPWLRINGTLASETEQQLSKELASVVLGVYVSDEIALHFSLRVFRRGHLQRALAQSDINDESIWSAVEGEVQVWEQRVFFSDSDLPMYMRFAKDDKQREARKQILASRQIVQGADVPWAADHRCLERLAQELRLPWLNDADTPTRTYAINPLARPARSPWWRRLLPR